MLKMDQMTVCNMKRITWSGRPSENSAAPLSSMKCFNNFKLFVLVLQPGALMFGFILTAIINLIFSSSWQLFVSDKA